MLIKDIPKDHVEMLISAIGGLRPEISVRIVAEDYALYQLGLILWFAVEENHIYASKFYWNNGVKEDVMFIVDGFNDWLNENMEFDDSLEDPDEGVWYYLPKATGTWQNRESKDGFARYLDVAAVHVELPPCQR